MAARDVATRKTRRQPLALIDLFCGRWRLIVTAKEAARRAVEETRRIMSQVGECSEQATFEAFDEAFDAEIVGWRMRLEELEDEDE